MTQDYPRNELIDFQHEDEDCDIIDCTYTISDELLKEIDDEFGKGVFDVKEFGYTCPYKSDTNNFIGITANLKKYLETEIDNYALTKVTKDAIIACNTLEDIASIEGTEKDEDLTALKKRMQKIIDEGFGWNNSLASYIAKVWIKPKMPKFWYFDDYYPLKGKKILVN